MKRLLQVSQLAYLSPHIVITFQDRLFWQISSVQLSVINYCHHAVHWISRAYSSSHWEMLAKGYKLEISLPPSQLLVAIILLMRKLLWVMDIFCIWIVVFKWLYCGKSPNVYLYTLKRWTYCRQMIIWKKIKYSGVVRCFSGLWKMRGFWVM